MNIYAARWDDNIENYYNMHVSFIPKERERNFSSRGKREGSLFEKGHTRIIMVRNSSVVHN